MEVQAPYPSNLLLFNRKVQEGKIVMGNNDCGFLDESQINFVNNRVEVNPRKRSREVSVTTPTTTTNMNSFGFSIQNPHHYHQQQRNQNHQLIDISQLQKHNHQSPNVVSTGLRLSFGDQNQQQQQQPSAFYLLSEELSLQSKQQSEELNYFLHAQGEQLRRTLTEKRQQHYRALIASAEGTVVRQLRDKEAEVEKATIRNTELQTKGVQLGLEAQSWRAKAHSLEAQAAFLQAQLQQAINLMGPMGSTGPQQHEREASGLGCAGDVEDNESVYVDPVSDTRVNSLSCKACQKRVASFVLLPCRHLCVCRDCDVVVQACPVCLSIRTAGVEVYLT